MKKHLLFKFLLTFTLALFTVGWVNGQSQGDILITEYMADPAAVADSEGEYFELYNTTGSDIDIDGWTILDDGSDSHTITTANGTTVIPAYGFLVLGQGDGTYNSRDYDISGAYTLANSGDEIVLKTSGGTEICRVNYTNGDVFEPASCELNNIANHTNGVTLESDYIAATNALSTDFGSPGTAGNTAGTGAPSSNDNTSYADATGVTQPPAANIASTVDAPGEAIPVFQFNIADAGTADGLPTEVTEITIKAGPNNTTDWTSDIGGGYLYKEGVGALTVTTEPNVQSDQVTFYIDDTELDIADGSSQLITLYVWLSTNVTDNAVIQGMIDADAHGFQADAAGSGFASDFGSDFTGNDFTIDVTSTQLSFITQPSDVVITVTMDPAVEVAATDANGSVDADYSSDITVSFSGSGSMSGTTTVTPVSGVATFNDLSFDTEESSVTLAANDGSFTEATSNTFNVNGLPVVTVPYSRDYETGDINTDGWTTQLVTGTLDWFVDDFSGDHFAKMSNFDGSNNTSETWLISPAIDLSVATTAIFGFYNACSSHTGDDIEVYISSDYDGLSAPSTATWNTLTATLSTGSYDDVYSGDIDISAYTGGNAYIAFKYIGTDSDGKTWQIDDISIIADPPVISNIAIDPTNPTSADAVTISADINDNGSVASASLSWGLTSEDYSEGTITMTEGTAPNYVADATIAAQAEATTVYYVITATDNEGLITITDEQMYYIPRTNASVTSGEYTVSDGTPGSITGVQFGTDLATFKSNITNPPGGSFEVYVSDGGAVATDLQDGYFLTGTAEDGTTEADYNIEVSSVVPDTDSEVSAPTTQVPATTVAVVDGDTEGEAFEVFSFDINDAGTADGLETKVSQIVLFYGPNMTIDFETEIDSGYLEVDGNPVQFGGEPVIGQDSIAFPIANGEIVIADGGSVNIIGMLYVEPTVADGKVIQFMVDADQHGFETSGETSLFKSTFTGGDVVGNNITINVEATELSFTTEPTDVYVDANIDPAVVVEAVDANGNIDTDYVTDIAITATGATLTSAVSETPVAGVATFNAISFTDEGTGVTLTASSGTLTDGTSAAFNVTVEPEKDLFFSEYIEGSSNGNNRALEIYNPTASEIDLSSYSIKQSYNGAGWGMREVEGTPTAMTEYVLPLSGMLAAGEVYVIYNNQADESITSVGDLALTYGDGCDGCRNASFTGDDAMGLFKGDVLIDVVGVELDKEGPWNVGDTTDATKDHTLIRKTGTTIGNTDWASSAGTNNDNSEWIIKSADYTSDLGSYGPKSGTDILTYTFDLQTGPADIDDVNHTVDIEVAFGTSVTALVADFTLSEGASAKVGTTDQVSGTTANDFSSPVTYTITAEDASTQNWVVTVTVATTQSSEKEITSFTVEGIVGSATITSGDATIDATVEYGTDVTSLKPTFEISNLATFVTDTSVAKDFTNAQDYIIEAEDGTQKTWTVTITEEAPTDVSDIASLRALYSETNETLYRITGEVTFTYATAPYFYIQDATAAILIYDHATYGVISADYSIGDNVQNLVGVFDTFGENMQFELVEDPGAAVSTGNTIDAQVVTIPTLAANYDDYDAELIKLEDVTFTETGTFAAGENYTLNNGSDQVAMRTNFSDADYIGEAIPTETLDVTALAGVYNGTVQVYPRSQSDMVEVTTGIGNPDGMVSMNIFPNPSNGLFTLEMNASKAGAFNVQIINIQGQVVYNKEINQDGFYKDQIDISNEASGIYYIRINDGKNTKVSKIMIQ